MLGTVLTRIFSQRFKNFEVIVVDSGSTDRTLEIAQRYDINLIEIKPEEFTFGRALNVGITNAQGKYIINLSAHAVPLHNDYIEKMVRNFKEPHIAGVYGKQVPFEDTNPIEKSDYDCCYGDTRRVQRNDCFFSNSNAAIRKDLWEKIPFSETMTGSEDWDWVKKTQSMGYSVVYEPESPVLHSHKESLIQIYERAKREAMGMKIIEPERHLNLRNSFHCWKDAVCSDIKHLVTRKFSVYWMIYSPLNRLAKVCGYYNGYRKVNR